MGVYFALIGALFLIALALELSFRNQHGKDKLFMISAGAILFALYVLKDNSVGTDYENYLNYFHNRQIPDLTYLFKFEDYHQFEKGYVFLTYIIGKISQTDLFFTLVIGFLMVYMPLITIRRYAKPVWAGVFLFITLGYYTNSFSLLRQTLAVYICWLSIPFILNREFWKFACTSFAACLFHTTALVFIPIYFIYPLKFNAKYILLGSCVFVCIYVILLPLMQFLTLYLTLNDYTDNEVSGGYTLLAFLMVVFVSCAFFIKEKSPQDHIFLHMLFMTLGLQILATKFNILTRIIDYYKLSLIALIPLVANHKAWGKYRALLIMLFCAFFCLYFYITNIANLQHIIPYQTRH